MVKDSTARITTSSDEDDEGAASRVNLENLDFNAQAAAVLDHFSAISADIKARDQLKRDKSPHPLAQIKLTTSIECHLQQAAADLEVLNVIYERITSSRRHRRKYSDEEINKFEETLTNLETQLSTYESTRYKRSLSAKKRANLDLSPNTEEVTPEDQALADESMQRWRKRDENFDEQLQEIGEAVERIGNVAITIGEKATVQAKSAITTMSKVQDTTSDISAISLQIKQVLRRQRRVELTLRIGLILTFLILLSIFIFLLFKVVKS